MSEISVVKHSLPELGYVARTSTQGAESKMVDKFVSFLIKRYQKLNSVGVLIFIEPQIDSGYPDIVIVEYSLSAKYNFTRRSLTVNDMKILYQIHMEGKTSAIILSDKLGYSIIEVEKSLKILAELKFINIFKNGNIVRINNKSYSPIKKIISVEAKVDKWATAIIQAERNIWFATESYILLNKTNCNESIYSECKDKGLGIILVNGTVKMILKSEKRDYPVSYGSLQFNEWLNKFKRSGLIENFG